MAFPPVLYIYKIDGSMTKVSGAVAWTRKRVIYSGGAYRDTFNAGYMGTSFPASLVLTGAAESVGGFPIGADGGTLDIKTSTITDSSITGDTVSLPDEVAHYPWRSKEFIRWMWEFWDATTVGAAMSYTVTTVSGSPNLTVGDNTLFTPGQEISGAGIPAGAIVVDFLQPASGSMIINRTTVQLNMNATASATVTATLTGANRLAAAFEDECIDWGEQISYPV
jgi:hypothetical protein